MSALLFLRYWQKQFSNIVFSIDKFFITLQPDIQLRGLHQNEAFRSYEKVM